MSAEEELIKLAKLDAAIKDPEVAHMIIDHDKVVGSRLVPGLRVDVKEIKDGISAKVIVLEGAVIKKPVHMCFGVSHKQAVQRIIMDIEIRKGAAVSFLAHCIFPNAVDVQHIMDAKISVGEGAEYTYLEKHIHGEHGGVKIYPKARVKLEKKARFKTEFELVSGRVGFMEIDYETVCGEESVMEMTARVSGRADDVIVIRETGYLKGEYARGVLKSRVAVRDKARCEVFNKMVATAAYARGHVDCKEIIQGDGVAMATPIVEVRNPKAHVTHEASIGSVDKKQLETLMSRGLSEDDAVELIIEGLLS